MKMIAHSHFICYCYYVFSVLSCPIFSDRSDAPEEIKRLPLIVSTNTCYATLIVLFLVLPDISTAFTV